MVSQSHYLEASRAQLGDVAVAGPRHLFGQFVEDVEIVGEAGGIIRRIQDDAPGEVALLAPVLREDG